MLNVMTKDPNFVSVRLPDDVANWLKDYATANNLIRADKPNMGGSIIAVVRSMMQGQTISNNVRQSSAAPDMNIKSIVDDALSSKIRELREEFEEHERIYQAQCQRGFEFQIATFREEMNEAIATAKKPLLSVMREKVIAA